MSGAPDDPRPPAARQVGLDELGRWAGTLLAMAGITDPVATVVGERLATAEGMGSATHGVALLPRYIAQIENSTLAREPQPRCHRLGSLLIVDADRAPGQYAAAWTLRQATDLLDSGDGHVAFVISNTGHLGALGSHLVEPLATGHIAFLIQATRVLAMTPPGGRKAAIGSNPLAFAAPAGTGTPPILMDFATTQVSRQQIHRAALLGRRLEPGWAVDEAGVPTDDPERALAGALMPAGGHKGVAIAMMVEILAGVLGDAILPPGGTPAGGNVFGFLLRPEAICGQDRFAHAMQRWIGRYRELAGEEAHMPGAALQRLDAARKDGIALTEAVRGQLDALAGRFGIAPLTD